MELVGFMGGAIDDNVIKHEFNWLSKEHKEAEVTEENSGQVGDSDLNLQPQTAEHLLLFIFST